jgi:hypothetical protein
VSKYQEPICQKQDRFSFVPGCLEEGLGEQGKIEQIDNGVSAQVAKGVTFVGEPIVAPVAEVGKIDDAIASGGARSSDALFLSQQF